MNSMSVLTANKSTKAETRTFFECSLSTVSRFWMLSPYRVDWEQRSHGSDKMAQDLLP